MDIAVLGLFCAEVITGNNCIYWQLENFFKIM